MEFGKKCCFKSEVLQWNQDNFSSVWFSKISTFLKTLPDTTAYWGKSERCRNAFRNTPASVWGKKSISNNKGVHYCKMFSRLAVASESLFPVLVTYSNTGRQLSGLQDNHIAGQKKGDGDGRVPISAQWSLWAGAKDNRVASKAVWDSCTGRELQRQKREAEREGEREWAIEGDRERERKKGILNLCLRVPCGTLGEEKGEKSRGDGERKSKRSKGSKKREERGRGGEVKTRREGRWGEDAAKVTESKVTWII